MFIISLTYVVELDAVDQFLPGHNQFLQKNYNSGMFICSGPKIPRTGGIIVCRAESLESVERLIEEDPFKINGVARYEITEFRVANCAVGFESYL